MNVNLKLIILLLMLLLLLLLLDWTGLEFDNKNPCDGLRSYVKPWQIISNEKVLINSNLVLQALRVSTATQIIQDFFFA